MEKKISFILNNKVAFTNFLTQFINLDCNILLELKPNDAFVVKSYTASRTAVKYSFINVSDVMEVIDKESTINQIIKICLYHAEDFIKSILRFPDSPTLKIDFLYEIDGNGECFATFIVLNNTYKEITVKCGTLYLFKFMPDNVVENVFAVDKALFSFPTDSGKMHEIQKDASFESGTDIVIEPEEINGKFYINFRGQRFNNRFEIKEMVNSNIVDFPIISKDYFKYLNENENYQVFITESAVLFISADSNTKTSLGRVIQDDDDFVSNNNRNIEILGTVSFFLKDKDVFVEFVKQFSENDRELLLELHPDLSFKAKSLNASRKCYMSSKINLCEFSEKIENNFLIDKLIYIAISDVHDLVSTIKRLKTHKKWRLDISYYLEENDRLVASEIKFSLLNAKNQTFRCKHLIAFSYLIEGKIVFNLEEITKNYSFLISSIQLNEIINDVENERDEFLRIKPFLKDESYCMSFNSGMVNYNIPVNQFNQDEVHEVLINKSHFTKLKLADDYHVYLTEQACVLVSLDSETTILLLNELADEY